VVSFIKSGFRAEDIRTNTLKYYEMFGVDGFTEMDVLWILNWAEALVKLRIKIEDKPVNTSISDSDKKLFNKLVDVC
jgi:hypothetical protein